VAAEVLVGLADVGRKMMKSALRRTHLTTRGALLHLAEATAAAVELALEQTKEL
jgi:hypothetical protein